jgi:hypothetical protein
VEISRAMELIQDSFDCLKRSGTIETDVVVNNETVLLGTNSPLDSIGFVTFVTEFEDRIQEETGEDHYLVLSDMNNFNVNNPNLTAGTLAKYTVQLIS